MGHRLKSPPEAFQLDGMWERSPPGLRLASASSDMIGWSRVLLSHTLDAARSY